MSAWKGPKQLIPMLVDRQQLAADPRNARAHDARSIKAIADSLARFGQRKPIVVRRGVVIAGNGQLAAAEALGWDRIAVVDGSDLSDTDATAFGIADNRTAELSTWDTDILKELMADLPTDVSIALGFDGEELTELFSSGLDGDGGGAESPDDKTYTAKIKSPIYEPKNERPALSSLVDRTKTDRLIASIEATEGLDLEMARFLREAATRHTVFDFRRIADAYAHADAKTQRLFEQSALVIVDFQQAIEHGYVRLSETMGKLADVEKQGAEDDA